MIYEQANSSSSKIWTPIHYRKYSRVYLRTDLQLLAKKTPTAGGWIFRIQTPPGGASNKIACSNKVGQRLIDCIKIETKFFVPLLDFELEH